MVRQSLARADQETRKSSLSSVPSSGLAGQPTYLQDPPAYLTYQPNHPTRSSNTDHLSREASRSSRAQPELPTAASSLTPSRSPWGCQEDAVRPHPIYPSSDLSSHAPDPS